jgi:hypothetical protein
MVYLPPDSSAFNPIEQLFAKLKALLRKAAERSVNGSGNALPNFSMPSPECANSGMRYDTIGRRPGSEPVGKRNW